MDISENRSRFAALQVLYSWVQASDHQFIYDTSPPNLVYSYDHGEFFPGGPNWTVDSLRAAADPALDPNFDACNLKEDELRSVAERLYEIRPRHIACAVAQVWDTWSVTSEEQIELATYLRARQLKLFPLLPSRG